MTCEGGFTLSKESGNFPVVFGLRTSVLKKPTPGPPPRRGRLSREGSLAGTSVFGLRSSVHLIH